MDDGIEVRQNHSLHDHASGGSREFDVVVEIPSNHGVLRIALECRDKKRRTDSPAVEAYAMKCRDCRVEKPVVVSSSGFTAPAQAKAKAHGVDTMVLRDTDDAEWPEWMQAKHIDVEGPAFHIERALLATPEGRLIPSFGWNNTKPLFREQSGEMSLEAVFNAWIATATP